MSRSYLLDTNILSYYFSGDPVVEPIFIEIETSLSQGFYSSITWVELLCYPALTEEQADEIRDYLRTLHRVNLTEEILDLAAELRRDYRTDLPDALIAACALSEKCILVTRNISDFKRISKISLLNPFA